MRARNAPRAPISLGVSTGEKIVELTPAPARTSADGPKVVGPGRRERGYLARLSNLEERLSKEAESRRHAERELDTSQRLERGCQRLIDRIEDRWSEDRDRLSLAEAQQKRMILALGALQRENEVLRERLELGAGATAQLAEQSGESPDEDDRDDDRTEPSPRPQRSQRRSGRSAPARRPGFFARLFGARASR